MGAVKEKIAFWRGILSISAIGFFTMPRPNKEGRPLPPNMLIAKPIYGSTDWAQLRTQIADALLEAAAESIRLGKIGFRVTQASELMLIAHKITRATRSATKQLISDLDIAWSDAWDNFLSNNKAAANWLGR